MKEGWKLMKLHQIGKIFNGNSINEKVKQSKYTDIKFGLPFIATKDIGNDSKIDYQNGIRIPENEIKQFKIAPSNTPLICIEGGSAGRKIGFTQMNVCFGNKLFAFSASQSVMGKFVFYFYFSGSFKSQFSNQMTGLIGGVSMNKFKDIQIPLPPLPEQQCIVSIIEKAFEAIDKAIENTQKNLQNVKELFESYLNSVFENSSEGWERKTLKELTTVLGDGLHGTPKYSLEGEYHFINGNNLTNGVIQIKENTKRVSVEEFNKYKKNLTDRTVLVSINGTLGNVAFYNGEKIILGKSACYFNLTDSIYKNFVKYVLSSSYFLLYAHKESTGATIKNVSLRTMREFLVPVPVLKTQHKIVEKLDAIKTETQNLEAYYQQKLANLEELKKSILNKAFAGEL